ncbi:MAG: hypothetical protein SFU56_15140 [Capsulimonadales bacterium]|nr:hypothetical protein [Capsulimonadales bacterium]
MKQQVSLPIMIAVAGTVLALLVGLGYFYLNPPVAMRPVDKRGAVGGARMVSGKSAPPTRPRASVN